MKKLLVSIFLGILCLISASVQADDLDKFNRPDYRIGTWKGTSFIALVKEKLPNATLIFLKENDNNLIEALQKDKIDGFITDRITAVERLKNYPDLTIEPTAIDTTQFAMAFNKKNNALKDEFASVIKDMKASGELKKLQDVWFSNDDSIKKSTIAPHGPKGVLRVGTTAVNPPFSFYMDNKLVGIEIELVNEVARRLGYSVDWNVIDHSSFIEVLQQDKIDIYAALITITPERSEQILFGEPDYEDTVVMITKKK